MSNNEKQIGSNYTVGSWQSKDVSAIYTQLEHPNWAPWLEAAPDSLAGRVISFPDGQLVAKSLDGKPLASLSMNKIFWNGNKNNLPTWDEVAGDPTTYDKTHIPTGNTLTMMSMNVHPEHTGEGYAKKLIEQAKVLAVKLQVDYLIGSFRPNEFGKYKLEHLSEDMDFATYCNLKRADGLPVDAWLRNLTRNGMEPLAVDPSAMTVSVSMDEFEKYMQEHKPTVWKQTSSDIWECEEVGYWKLDYNNGVAVYKESNLWGLIWKKPGLQ